MLKTAESLEYVTKHWAHYYMIFQSQPNIMVTFYRLNCVVTHIDFDIYVFITLLIFINDASVY